MFEYRYMNVDDFDPNVFFQYQHAWEIYDENKKYKEEFDIEGKQYKNIMYRVVSKNNREVTYMVTEEIFDEDELQLLVPYCQCARCRKWRINPIKYITCPCCVGCVASDSPSSKNVVLARIKRDNSEIVIENVIYT